MGLFESIFKDEQFLIIIQSCSLKKNSLSISSKTLRRLIFNSACLQVPGMLSLATKLLPTVMNLLRKLAEEGAKPPTTDTRGNPLPGSKSFRNGVNTSSAVSSSASSEITSENGTEEYSSSSKQD